MPQVDILLHTGDLTNFGDIESLKESVKMLGTIEAELKLVIAGNHDISLDPTPRVENMSEEEYVKYHKTALEIMTGVSAKEAGITYLQEGTYTFTLDNGATFRVYASPYTADQVAGPFHIKLLRIDSTTLHKQTEPLLRQIRFCQVLTSS